MRSLPPPPRTGPAPHVWVPGRTLRCPPISATHRGHGGGPHGRTDSGQTDRQMERGAGNGCGPVRMEMDGWTGGRSDRRTDGWMGGRTAGWMDGRTGRWTDGQEDGWRDRWTDGWLDDGWMGGWADKWTDGRVDRQTDG